MSELIDTVPDADGDVIEVGTWNGAPVLRMPHPQTTRMLIFDDENAERFSRAWNEALLRCDRAKAAQP